jgi:hypothetical protein
VLFRPFKQEGTSHCSMRGVFGSRLCPFTPPTTEQRNCCLLPRDLQIANFLYHLLATTPTTQPPFERARRSPSSNMRAHTPQQATEASRRRSSIGGGHRASMGSSIPRVQSRVSSPLEICDASHSMYEQSWTVY